MPDLKKTLVFYEGDDDKAFLEKLLEAGLRPVGWQLAIRDKTQHAGKEGLIRQILPVVSPANGIEGRAVVLVDLDELTPPQRVEWFRASLSSALQAEQRFAGVTVNAARSKGRVQAFELVSGQRVGHVVVVPVGDSDDAELKSRYQVDRHAIDDWVLRLALNQKVFEGVSDLAGIGYEVTVTKYLEVAALFRQNGLEVRKAKTYVQILRALAAIGPSTATIVGRFVQKGIQDLGTDEFTVLLKPFLDDLFAASDLLND